MEVYYFTPFSQPLASAINSELVSFYDGVYADGTESDRGAKYSYYWVTLQQDFPSVLVEMGFISNERECMVIVRCSALNAVAVQRKVHVCVIGARNDRTCISENIFALGFQPYRGRTHSRELLPHLPIRVWVTTVLL